MKRLAHHAFAQRHKKGGAGNRPHSHDLRRTKRYDGLLQLTESLAKTPSAQTTLSLTHTFGKRFELQQAQRSDTAGGLTRSKDSRYGYDDELRLTQAQTDSGGVGGTDTETFTLDALANRIAHNKYPGAWQFDANNRLTQRGSGACGSAGTVCYAYDDAGNLQTKTEGARVTHYAYDTVNRLVEVKNGSDQLIARYGYDPLSRRLWKEQYRGQDGNPLAAPKRTTYLYADEGLIAEATQAITLNADGSVSASAAPVVTTQYGPRPDASFTTGMLFIKTQNSKGQDTLAYYHRDHLGTPIQATDKTGRVVWAADYNAFGLATLITPAPTEAEPTIASNLRLPGQYWDEETGLHYNWHRYYDAATGRYIQSDPIGLAGGINAYVYVSANPLSHVDPTGEFLIPLITGAVGAIAGGVGNYVVQKYYQNKCDVEWKDVLNAAAWGGIAGAALPFVGGGLVGAGVVGAGANLGQYGTSMAWSDSGPSLQGAAWSAGMGTFSGALGGAFTRVTWYGASQTAMPALARQNQTVATLSANSGFANGARNGMAGVSGSLPPDPSAPQDCGCQK